MVEKHLTGVEFDDVFGDGQPQPMAFSHFIQSHAALGDFSQLLLGTARPIVLRR